MCNQVSCPSTPHASITPFPLPDALPISVEAGVAGRAVGAVGAVGPVGPVAAVAAVGPVCAVGAVRALRAGLPLGARRALRADRKSTRLNSSHSQISYAVFCLKKTK